MELRELLIRELSVIVDELIRRALGGKIPRRNFSKLDQEITLLAQNFRCNRCGEPLDEYNFNHKDGNRENNHISNCEALCLNCHAKVTRLQQLLKMKRHRARKKVKFAKKRPVRVGRKVKFKKKRPVRAGRRVIFEKME